MLTSTHVFKPFFRIKSRTCAIRFRFCDLLMSSGVVGGNERSSTETSTQLRDLRDDVDSQAHELVWNVFPDMGLNILTNITELDDGLMVSLENDGMSTENLLKKPDPTSKMRSITRHHLQNMASHCNVIKLWISLKTPKIEGGNNFGVAVQEAIGREVVKVMEFCDKVSAHVTMHSETRASLIRKIEKYPSIEDYKVALVEADEQELFYLKEVMYNLRNFYVLLQDIIVKNQGKILKPKSESSMHLY